MNFFKKTSFILVSSMALLASACTGGDSSSSSTTTTDGTTTADVSSISNVPSMNLSAYDNTTSTSGTASLNSLYLSASDDDDELAPTYSVGEGIGQEGSRSTAFCQVNMQKEEVFRTGAILAGDLCSVQTLEKYGVITVPTDGTRSIFHFDFSDDEFEETAEEQAAKCDDIPEENLDEKEWCLSEETQDADDSMMLRVGVIDGTLEIDFCDGASGSETLQIEANAKAADDKTYVVSSTETDDWGGYENWATIAATISDFEQVIDGDVEFNDDSSIAAEITTHGGYGTGTIHFEAHGAKGTGHNIVKGAFEGNYDDQATGTTQEFTGKVYAQYGGATNLGTAKMSFSGTVPPFAAPDMLYGVDEASQASILDALASELGIPGLTADTLLCPNMSDDFDENDNVKPMVEATDGQCPAFSDERVESFSITNAFVETDFGMTEVIQIALITSDDDSPFYDAVNAFDISALTVAAKPAFARNWDCTGSNVTEVSFETIFNSLSQTEIMEFDTAMQECEALYELANGWDGAGGHDCYEEENSGEVDNFIDQGMDAADWGVIGGDGVTTSAQAQCKSGGMIIGEYIFLDPVDITQGLYCLIDEDGVCNEFSYNSNSKSATGLNLNYGGGVTVTSMSFTVSNEAATAANITFNVPGLGSCTNAYTWSKPTFDGGIGEGDDGFEMPEACTNAGIDDGAACEAFCYDTKSCYGE